jgi:hypothetical protein
MWIRITTAITNPVAEIPMDVHVVSTRAGMRRRSADSPRVATMDIAT